MAVVSVLGLNLGFLGSRSRCHVRNAGFISSTVVCGSPVLVGCCRQESQSGHFQALKRKPYTALLEGSWVVRSGILCPSIWVITIVTLLLAPLITTHEPPSTLYLQGLAFFVGYLFYYTIKLGTLKRGWGMTWCDPVGFRCSR